VWKHSQFNFSSKQMKGIQRMKTGFRKILAALIFACSSLLGQVEISGEITTNTTWFAGTEYHLVGQTFVNAGVTLTIEPGTVIKAFPDDGQGLAPALIIQRDGTIIADGTAEAPITFTSILPEDQLPQRGTWGGLILLGNAPISTAGGENFVEGLLGVPYGGDDPSDKSGILHYVRVWYGGRSIGQDNEINGITLAGVGRGTVVDHCEVAWNLDDGFEMFGGTVDLTYCSVLFVGDDSFDTDEGYQGRGQFLFAMIGEEDGNRAHEMDNKTNNDLDSQPRSHPRFANVTVVGSGTDAAADNDNMLRLREGTGGDFRNYIVVEGKEYGLRNSDNGSEVVTSDWEEALAAGYPNYLYWSANNIIYNCDYGQFHGDYGLGALAVNPMLLSLDGRETGGIIDPRPRYDSPAYSHVDQVADLDFFIQTDYKGAFGDNLWLTGLSWLDSVGRLPEHPENIANGDINQDGSTDILDVVTVIAHILGTWEIPADELWIVDLNEDDWVDILDIVLLVDFIITVPERGNAARKVTIHQDADGRVWIESDGAVGAIQLEMTVGDGFTMGLSGNPLAGDYAITGNRAKVLIVHPDHELFTCIGEADITSVMAATAEGYIQTEIVGEYMLLENYPNPFNPSTTLSYRLQEQDHAAVVIYDMTGREVVRLVDDVQSAGRHAVVWNGSDSRGTAVAAGFYIAKLSTSNSGFSQKITLLK